MRKHDCLAPAALEVRRGHGRELFFTPSQQEVAEPLLQALSIGGILVLRAKAGLGRTAILQHVHACAGGAFLHVHDLLRTLQLRQPAAIEESFLELIRHNLLQHELVIVDDLHLVLDIVEHYNYARTNLFHAVLTAVLAETQARNKTLIFGFHDEPLPPVIAARSYAWLLDEFTASDYEALCKAHLAPPVADRLDYDQIHRFAPELNAHQLTNACRWLQKDGELGTQGLIDYLSAHNILGNVDIDEVESVDWRDLKGVDDVIEALEAKIALPFDNRALATELQLRPKRGVLLAGPPGTGKTTIGKALAHRLKGKFFLIDGTLIAGTSDFYCDVKKIFEAAKANAPSVIFIDDADVIFEDKQERGLYRYLLTMLDGLESASAGRVCVMITAMNPANVPAALLRSGRVELWLETRLPDVSARAAILREKTAKLPAPVSSVDIAALAAASRDLTGADLKAVVEDGKLLLAHDKIKGRPLRPIEDYFLEAIATVRTNRRNFGTKASGALADTVKVGFLAGN